MNNVLQSRREAMFIDMRQFHPLSPIRAVYCHLSLPIRICRSYGTQEGVVTFFL